MPHVLDQAVEWQRAGIRFAMATVLRTWSSAPHAAGASMLVAEDGTVVGAVSGGCVEGAVCAVAEQVLAERVPARESYGIADEDSFAAGLTCGGTIEVYVREIGPQVPLARVARAVADGVPVALVTLLKGDGRGGACLAVGTHDVCGTLDDAALDRTAAGAARGMLARGDSGAVPLGAESAGVPSPMPEPLSGPGGSLCAVPGEVLVQSFAAPPRLWVFGANDFARSLVRIGALLGHRVTVCDARPVFATPQRFPGAHEVAVDWPHRWFAAHQEQVDAATAICVLTHDAKFDVPLLRLALRSRAGYVGAMGSRRTHEDRLARLRATGLSDAELNRLRSPIGLDLGGHGPEETALSIASEIIALRRGGSGLPLTGRTTPVHAAAATRPWTADASAEDAGAIFLNSRSIAGSGAF